MHITEVKYERLVSFGAFNHVKLGAVASLSADESPVEAMDHLHQFVKRQHDALKTREVAAYKAAKKAAALFADAQTSSNDLAGEAILKVLENPAL